MKKFLMLAMLFATPAFAELGQITIKVNDDVCKQVRVHMNKTFQSLDDGLAPMQALTYLDVAGQQAIEARDNNEYLAITMVGVTVASMSEHLKTGGKQGLYTDSFVKVCQMNMGKPYTLFVNKNLTRK